MSAFKRGDIIRWDILYHIGRVKSVRKNSRSCGRGSYLTVEILYGKPFYANEMVGVIHDSQVGPYTREVFESVKAGDKLRRVPLEGLDWNKLESLVPA